MMYDAREGRVDQMNYDIIEATSFEEVLSEIEENGKYKRFPPKEKTWMTVPEMGKSLERI